MAMDLFAIFASLLYNFNGILFCDKYQKSGCLKRIDEDSFALKVRWKMIKNILLVEDDSSLNRAISLKLSNAGYKVHRASSMKEAFKIYDKERGILSLIICDVGLPDGTGLEFCKAVRKQEEEGEKVMFLFLTAMDTDEDMIKGYEAGGDDYVTKPFSLNVLTSKIKVMMKRIEGQNSHTSESAETAKNQIRSKDIVLYIDEKRVKKGESYLKVTANEYRLLEYFMENPMKIISKNQLLESIWDSCGKFVDDNTVSVNIKRLRDKIEDDPSKPEVIKNVRGLGYIWERKCERL